MIAMTGAGGVGAAGPAGGVAPSGRPARTDAAGFMVPAEPGTAGPSAPASTDAAGLVGMLALQERGEAERRDREAHRRGLALVAELAALQRAILAGGGDPAGLARLAELAAVLPEAADPALAALVRAVALRAKVVLARADMALEMLRSVTVGTPPAD